MYGDAGRPQAARKAVVSAPIATTSRPCAGMVTVGISAPSVTLAELSSHFQPDRVAGLLP